MQLFKCDRCGEKRTVLPTGRLSRVCLKCEGIMYPLAPDKAPAAKVPSGMARAFAEKFHGKYLKRAIERKRSRTPWSDFEFDELFERLQDETSELYEAATELKDLKAVMDECLDVANFAWFIYEQAKAKIKTTA